MMKDSIYKDMKDSEKKVADYLRELDLWWIYESPLFLYDENERPRVWTPDFYIPKLGMYVEVCGADLESYQYRKTVYKKNQINVIFLQLYKEEKKWKNYLVKRIIEIDNLRHAETTKMFHSRLDAE